MKGIVIAGILLTFSFDALALTKGKTYWEQTSNSHVSHYWRQNDYKSCIRQDGNGGYLQEQVRKLTHPGQLVTPILNEKSQVVGTHKVPWDKADYNYTGATKCE